LNPVKGFKIFSYILRDEYHKTQNITVFMAMKQGTVVRDGKKTLAKALA